jgi:phosphate/phosphite/phosphonate ABC transporter binding protein
VAHASPPSSRPLAFAVVSGAADAEHHLTLLCHALERALSRPVTATLLPSYAALAPEVSAGTVHIAWAPPLVGLDLESAGLASIALCCSRGGQAAYHSALFTRHVSPIEKLIDLAGRHVAWVDPSSSAGYLVPRMRLASAGLPPATLFGRESFLGSHERVACAVLAGEADVGATYLSLDPRTGEPLSAGWLEAGAAINGAFILATAGPIPADAIVLSNALGPALRAALTEHIAALSGALPDSVGGLFRADSFLSPSAAHFDELRTLRAALPG